MDTTVIGTDVSYRGDPQLKATLVAEATAHREADRLIRGSYYENGTAAWRGCAVGCTVVGRLIEEARDGGDFGDLLYAAEHGWHDTWARVTGLPRWLGALEDRIFEYLPGETGLHLQWPVRLFNAVPVGVDLDPVREAFCRDVVMDPDRGAVMHAARALAHAGLTWDASRLRAIPRDSDWLEIERICSAADASYAVAATATATVAATAAACADLAANATATHATATATVAATAAACADLAANAFGAQWAWTADRLIHHLERAA